MGPPSIPRQRTGEEGRPLRPHAGLGGPVAQGPGRQDLPDQLCWECRCTAWCGTGDSWKVALSTHDRCDGGGPRRGKAGFRWALVSSPWALTPRPLSF